MNKNILIIEDDPGILTVYSEKLKIEGFSVSQATTGKEGFELVKKLKPGLVLLDIMLPGDLNGFDVLESIKKDEGVKNIPVIVITNVGDEEKVARDIGAVDYLIKANTDLNQVVEKIKSHLK
jgi:DNA-binding response OmpR family regulator